VLAYVIRRLLTTLPALLGVYTLVFILLHIVPGDPAMVMLGEGSASVEHLAALRRETGLDRSLPEQYVGYLLGLLRGDLGRSIRYNRPVSDLILEFFPYTLQLAAVGLGLAVVTGMALGVLAALRQNSWLDTGCMLVALSGVSMPSFWFGLMLIFTFVLTLGWFPITGQEVGLARLVLPALALGVQTMAVITRLTRSSLVEVLRQDYITTARAKGLSEFAVAIGHALRNALIPVVTIVGVEFGSLLSGAVIIETVFARPGMGRLIVESIMYKDFPALQSAILCVAVCYVLSNLAVDLAYGYLDPRIRIGGAA
jgi:peptide/nickel transport system permease protein/oligopeptide transport system permease protein